MQQKRREQLLDVSKDDVKNVAQQYLVQAIDRANLVVLGDKRDWMEKAEEQWDVHDLGLSNQPATTGL